MKALISNLGLSKKFFVLGLVGTLLFVPPLALLTYNLLQNKEIARHELDGVSVSRFMIEAIRLAQQHRGISAALLGGNSSSKSNRSKKQQEVDKAYRVVANSLQNRFSDSELPAGWKSITDNWHTIADLVKSDTIAASDSFSRHNQLIANMLLMHDSVLDHSHISLDPSPAAYFTQAAAMVQLPRLTELLGQIRGKGSYFLAHGKISTHDKLLLSGLLDRANSVLKTTEIAFQKAFVRDQGLRKNLRPKMKKIHFDLVRATAMITSELLEKDTLDYSIYEFIKETTHDIDDAFELNVEGTNAFEKRLRNRIEKNQSSMNLLLALFALLTAGGIFLGWSIARSIVESSTSARDMALLVAKGDLSSDVPSAGADEMGQLLNSIDQMQESLSKVVLSVRRNADSVAHAAAEISAGNTDLSHRTELQAAAIEQTSSSMASLGRTVEQNADNAQQGKRLAVNASDLAVSGGAKVDQIIETMNEINDSSNRIVNIINVIESIAFQTNILALNAAIEAARAGEYGRGFAVVATEVRTLAQRSGAAATEIRSLIDTSVDRVDSGSRLVTEAGAIMNEIVSSTKQVTNIVGEISDASSEQSTGVNQVSSAISHIDETTQQNSALVEQSAAASQSLKDQAQQLVNTVAVFKLTN